LLLKEWYVHNNVFNFNTNIFAIFIASNNMQPAFYFKIICLAHILLEFPAVFNSNLILPATKYLQQKLCYKNTQCVKYKSVICRSYMQMTVRPTKNVDSKDIILSTQS
jgi:hypothetical protein